MSFEIISLLLLVLSSAGLGVLVSKKIPELSAMPEPQGIFLKEETKIKIKEKAREVFERRSNSFEKFLQKLLSKTRILSLRAENKLSGWLTRLRERSMERTKEIDNYWKEIKTSIKKKDRKR
jgi:ribosomal protein S17E